MTDPRVKRKGRKAQGKKTKGGKKTTNDEG